MFKNRTTIIIIIAIIFSLAAGIFAFYQNRSQGKKASINLISAILPAVQTDGTTSNLVQLNTEEYNQTLAAVLNTFHYQEAGLPPVTWEADLNAALLHGSISQFKVGDQPKVIALVQNQSRVLIQDLYNDQIRSNIKLLQEPATANSLTQNPLIIALFGLLVGALLGSALVPKKN